MRKYKISIIIPVFNVENYICDAMKSLSDQTIGFDNLQVIFVDDCSTDRSGRIIDDYAKQYANVIAAHLSTNSGAAGAPRNEALKLATADYIMFLDPDDFFEINACCVLHEYIHGSDYDLVSGFNAEINETGKITREKAIRFEGLEDCEIIVNEQYGEVLKLQSAFWTKIYKRSIIVDNKIDFPEAIPGQDTVFLCEYLMCCNKISYINKNIIYYRLRDSKNKSISNNLNETFFIGIQTCYKLVFDIMKKRGFGGFFKVFISDSIDYYISKMLSSNFLEKVQFESILRRWKWLFDYYNNSKLIFTTAYPKIIESFILREEFEKAATIMLELRKLNMDLIEMKNCLQKEDALYLELKTWSQQLEEAKSWYADQCESKDASILELKAWIQQVEEAKNWHADQSNRKDDVILKLQNRLQRLENDLKA